MHATMRRPPVALSIAILTLPIVLLGAPAAAEHTCDDVLVTHTPDRSDGDRSAVAITSQVLVADVEGWESVTWETDDRVAVDHVIVSDRDGDHVVEGGRTGHAGPATALTFCGPAVATSAVGATTGSQELARPLLGAAIGVVLATLVLLLSHAARRERSDALRGGAA